MAGSGAAYEAVGLWFMSGHGVPQALVDRVFVEPAGFHVRPLVAYCDAMERAALAVLPIYAVALDLPPEAFREPQHALRMSHYHTPVLETGEYGLAPHAGTSFMTLLAQSKVPGLSLRTVSGRWIDAPAIEGALLINSGQSRPRAQCRGRPATGD